MCKPSEQEITAIEAEILEEKGREVYWAERDDWMREEQAFHERIDNMITRQMDFN